MVTLEEKTTKICITADVFGISTTRRATTLALKNVIIDIQEGENEKLPLEVASIKGGSSDITFALGTLDRAAVKHIYRVVKPPMRYPHTPCNTCRIKIVLLLTPRGEMIENIMILSPTVVMASNLTFDQGFVNRFFEEIVAEAKRRLEGIEGTPYKVTPQYCRRNVPSIP